LRGVCATWRVAPWSRDGSLAGRPVGLRLSGPVLFTQVKSRSLPRYGAIAARLLVVYRSGTVRQVRPIPASRLPPRLEAGPRSPSKRTAGWPTCGPRCRQLVCAAQTIRPRRIYPLTQVSIAMVTAPTAGPPATVMSNWWRSRRCGVHVVSRRNNAQQHDDAHDDADPDEPSPPPRSVSDRNRSHATIEIPRGRPVVPQPTFVMPRLGLRC
jgi:hypothetical protein